MRWAWFVDMLTVKNRKCSYLVKSAETNHTDSIVLSFQNGLFYEAVDALLLKWKKVLPQKTYTQTSLI